MAAQITNYQCPGCTGPLTFSAETGKLLCEYCGTPYEIDEIEALYAEKESAAAEAFTGEAGDEGEWDTSGLSEDWGNESEQLRTYCCPSCSAELICEETTAATACPYCGNPTVVPGQFAGALRPDYLLPFKLDKDAAVEALRKHYKGKFLLPGAFAKENQLQTIQGVYVPFWLFDGEAAGSAVYMATFVTKRKTSTEEITTTDYYEVLRAGSVAFEKVPVDASQKMPDEYMDSIEPFDYAELRKFSTAYLPGYLADKYDVTVENSRERADSRCRETLERAMRETVRGYTSCTTKSQRISLRRGKVHYALLPVWLLTTKWQGKDYLYAVNGQTGKTAGSIPISKAKLLAMFAAIAAPLSVVFSLIVHLLT